MEKAMENSKENQLRSYLCEKRTLIVEPLSSTRAHLKKIIVKLGGEENMIDDCSSLENIHNIVQNHPYGLIIAEYKIGPYFGFDLFRECRKRYPQYKDSLFILITNNDSQSVIAQAVEEDVDAFIIRPFSSDDIKIILQEIVFMKMRPSEYLKKIEEGKGLLDYGQWSAADVLFKEAIQLHSKPALAHYYSGLSQIQQQKENEAEDQFVSGLTHNNIHYKCLSSALSLYMKNKQYPEAYEMAKQLAHHYPANPERLATVIHLSVITESFDDIEQYYEIFQKMDLKNEVIIKYICAGIFICGKFFLLQGKKEKALKLFEHLSLSHQGQIRFLRSIIELLVDYKMNEATHFFNYFKPEHQGSEEYQISQFLIRSNELEQSEMVNQGLTLLNTGIKNIFIFKQVLSGLAQQGKEEQVKHWAKIAISLWPEKASFFKNYT